MTLLIPELDSPTSAAMSSIRRGARLRVPAGGPAPTVPAAPTLIAAIPGDGHVTIEWTASGDGGSPITGYNVLRGTAPGAEKPLVQDIAASPYVDESARNGVTYYYVVAAVNAVGASGWSAERVAIPQPATIPAPVSISTGAVIGNGPLVFTTSEDAPAGSTVLVTVALSNNDPTPTAVTVTDSVGNPYVSDVVVADNSFLLARASGIAFLPAGSQIDVTVMTAGSVAVIVGTVTVIASAALSVDRAPGGTTDVPSNRIHTLAVTNIAGDLMFGADVAFSSETGVTTSAPFTQIGYSELSTRGLCVAYELPATADNVSLSDTWDTAHSGTMTCVAYKLAAA